MVIQPSFLVPGGLEALFGLKVNRFVHFVCTFMVTSVIFHMLLRPLPAMFQFEVQADVVAALPGLAAVLGLIAAALLIKLVPVGRFTVGFCAVALTTSLFVCGGALLPSVFWGEAVMDQIHRTVGLPGHAADDAPMTDAQKEAADREKKFTGEEIDAGGQINIVPLIPRMDMDGVPDFGLAALIASLIALGLGVAAGVLCAVGNYQVEALCHSLFGAVLVGMGLGHLWAVGAAFVVGAGIQLWSNRPDKRGSSLDHQERATQMWKHVQDAGALPGE